MTIKTVLQDQRRVLLDLTYRNRLLSLPKKPSSRTIVVHDELGAQVASILLDKKSMSFAPLPGGATEERLSDDELIQDLDEPVLTQPDDEIDAASGLASHHTDTKLQTKLKSEHLQKRLLEIYYEARTMLEEQGVNVLYLAMGQLRYGERAGTDEMRVAPLVLLPVALERKSAKERFKLKWTEEDPQENLSLREKLRTEFGLTLPPFPEPDLFDFSRYVADVREALSSQTQWEVLENDIQLGFFSFSKLLMFLDLDSDKWPEGKQLDSNPLIAGLLGDGFNEPDVGFATASEGELDQLISAEQLKHVMDCDSSQALAIEAVRRGQSLVIQGPPGTGKSQTIANVIATAVADGKKVLFVAEKMAALEVVKRRLENIGLGPLCLELHSNKANKKTVLEELSRTLNVGRPTPVDVAHAVNRLETVRTRLNAHAAKMHAPVGASQQTPFRIMGMLGKLMGQFERPRYQLKAAADWTMDEARQREAVLAEIAERAVDIGDPDTNPWRGITHAPVMRPHAEEMVAPAATALAAHARLRAASDALASGLNVPPASNLAGIARHLDVARTLVEAPAFDRTTISSAVWSAGLGTLREAIRDGRRLSEIRSRRSNELIESAWSVDWTQQRMVVAAKGQSLFRFLDGGYRAAIAQLQGVLKGPLPKDYRARVGLLDDLIEGVRAGKTLEPVKASARAAFGSVWNDGGTDWGLAESILDWVEKQQGGAAVQDIRALAAGLQDAAGLQPLIHQALEACQEFSGKWDALVAALQLDMPGRFRTSDVTQIELAELGAALAGWTGNVGGLLAWLNFHDVVRQARDLGLSDVVAQMGFGTEALARVVPQFWMAFYLELLNQAAQVYPELSTFDGQRQELLVKEFRELDRNRLVVAQYEAAAAHFEGAPRAIANIGALGTLRAEIMRKRNHMALRKLFEKCASPIQALKPVFMMSPLSVAQFLAPGAVEFDLLVIDEASQVEPVDALGAVARCRQIVVVGDDKQLPPTSFFSRITGGDDLDEPEEGAQAKDLESILSLCAAKGLPQRMLKWHYRSRHESLIAVSNKEFYEGELFIVPSPDRERRNAGLRFHFIEDGRFDRGNTQKNHAEAVAIAKAAIEHAKTCPHLTLGVGAMSVRQRQAISDEIELARREHPELDLFISQQHKEEPFFVKNLENIQGDERDVILISIGYGRAKSDDRMYQSFGPLNADGGHRRLNVLISRARQRCEVFSSIKADDIRIDERSKFGLVALKTFLKYAEHGDLGVAAFTGKAADSPFEEAVQEVLSKHGFKVDNQVGVAGFFIDLAIVDPESTGRYLLGIECDGATYHSAASARDRDRLRQEILETHGWTIHRIWSTDWFQRAQQETERLLRAVASAKSAQKTFLPKKPPVGITMPNGVSREAVGPAATTPAATEAETRYVEANFVPGNAHLPPHEVPTASMAHTVTRIIEIEGPIHLDVIVSRVRDLWKLGRAGARIQGAVTDALRHIVGGGQVKSEADCYFIVDAPVRVRDRGAAESSSPLKKPALLPPQEIRAAVTALLEEAHGGTRDEVIVAVSRALGFQATSQQLRDAISRQIDVLLDRGSLVEAAGQLTVVATPVP